VSLLLAPPSAVRDDGACEADGGITQRFTTDPNEVVAERNACRVAETEQAATLMEVDVP
jgi:hypothetical protein